MATGAGAATRGRRPATTVEPRGTPQTGPGGVETGHAQKVRRGGQNRDKEFQRGKGAVGEASAPAGRAPRFLGSRATVPMTRALQGFARAAKNKRG